MTIFLWAEQNFTKYFIKRVQKTGLLLRPTESACLIPRYVFQDACMRLCFNTNDCHVMVWNPLSGGGKLNRYYSNAICVLFTMRFSFFPKVTRLHLQPFKSVKTYFSLELLSWCIFQIKNILNISEKCLHQASATHWYTSVLPWT